MKSQPVASIQRNCLTRARTVLESQEILVKTCVPVATATTGCTGTQTSFKQPKAFRKYPQGVEPRCWSSVLACSASFASGSLPLPSLRFRLPAVPAAIPCGPSPSLEFDGGLKLGKLSQRALLLRCCCGGEHTLPKSTKLKWVTRHRRNGMEGGCERLRAA